MNGNTLIAVIIVCMTIYHMWQRWLMHKERMSGLGINENDDMI